ncbi:carbamoyl phosphate synthase small subunit [Candidatus Saccharibacteria bacterium]|nr:MAG: carbamoyl phosphate synthase small subunit [Candidatus Saccharibacteria bacterium]PID98708.1 MAG: carbamoyl phosphate synthase small subunit [Candidatus Saccharibacteria bacterium]
MEKNEPKTRPANTRVQRSERNVFSCPEQGRLTLSDGKVFAGLMPDWQTSQYDGEVVFSTGMTGYVESLTDPSFAGQILVFTYPLIGNYGVNPAASESDRIQVRGVIVSELAPHWSHQASELSLPEWLRSQQIPLLSGVDTRALTKHLRTRGVMSGTISAGAIKPPHTTTVPVVSIPEPITYGAGAGKKKVILVDCGLKENILRSLLALGLEVKRVPYNYDFLGETYDGVVISSGPGDPASYHDTIAITKKLLADKKPLLGICLGNQIMALASGGTTYKLKFGHRGHNQPCQDATTKHCVITSQNHGYAIDEKTLPRTWRVSYRNLNDSSVEGIEHVAKPFFSVQFHPEACPGPTDSADLFKKFGAML